MSPSPPAHQALLHWLTQPHAHRTIALLATLLLTPCLATRLVLDDHVLAVRAGRSTTMAGLPPKPLGLFTFTTGDPQQNHALMDEGVILPWWSEPRHLNAFFRPISALTHVLDFTLWPLSAAAMHLHSLVWYAALLLALAHVYRCIEGPASALGGLALLLFAIDDAHGPTVAWIANRNALVSITLSLPALSSHHRWVAHGFRAGAWLAPACLMLGLCGGETAICMIGYLVAYAVCFDTRDRRRRLLSVAPYLAIFVAHRVLSHFLGLGSFGSSAYHDPVREPLGFAHMLSYNLPVLLSAELFVPVADLAFWADVAVRTPLFLWCVSSLAMLGWLAWPVLRVDRHARFWALGMLLAVVPVSASLPGDRLLIAVGIGGAALLARLLAAGWQAGEAFSPTRRLASGSLLVLHLVAAPLALPVRAYAFEPLARLIDRIDAGLPATALAPEQTAIVLNAPLDIMLSYVQAARAERNVPRPQHLYWLSSASSETTVTRIDAQTLRVEQAQGFLFRPEETHYRSDAHALGVGSVVNLSEMQARIVEVTAGSEPRPKRVDFRFVEPLESTRYAFRIYQDGELVPWQPSNVGTSLRLPAHDFFRLMAEEARR